MKSCVCEGLSGESGIQELATTTTIKEWQRRGGASLLRCENTGYHHHYLSLISQIKMKYCVLCVCSWVWVGFKTIYGCLSGFWVLAVRMGLQRSFGF